MSHCIAINENYQGLNPVVFGYEEHDSNHCCGPAIRTNWLIHFIVSGVGYFKKNGEEWHVTAGDMFVIAPFEETLYRADPKNPWSYIWIGFTSSDDLPVNLDPVIKCPAAIEIFEKMKECEFLTVGRSAFLAARLWDLFSLLSQETSKHEDYIKSALDYIHEDYMSGITVEEVAERVHLERTYFSVLFKKKTGITPKEYLKNYRMSMAASLLSRGDVPVSVAAHSVGYSDIFTFSKMFKKHFGISPREYVSNAKKNI